MKRISKCLATVLLVVCCGCGDGGPGKAKLYPVSGKVTVGGKPPADCAVNFISASGTGAAETKLFGGKIGADGGFTLVASDGRTGAEPGKYKVVLQPPADAKMKAMMNPGGPGGAPPKVEAPFPPEYSEAGTSPKEVEVKAETNTINIDIP